MSFDAVANALKQPIKNSGAKFVLVIYASCANGKNGDLTAYPSIAEIVEQTGLNRKSVIANVQRLVDWGYLKDTGERRGKTGQVHVFSIFFDDERVPKTEQSQNWNGSKNGTVKQSQKWNSSKNGTLSNLQRKNSDLENSPKNGTVPNLGHGISNYSLINKNINNKNKNKPTRVPARETTLPDWLPADVWKDFIDFRKKIKAPLTDRACELIIDKLSKLRAEGYDPTDVLNQSIVCGWKGVFEVKPKYDRNAAKPKPQTFDNCEYKSGLLRDM
jgi:hypothetical protein